MNAHGHYRRYNAGCRCDLCRAANTARCRAEVARRSASPVPATVEHGKAATYKNWGCRCRPCTTAHSVYHRPYRRAYRQRQREAQLAAREVAR